MGKSWRLTPDHERKIEAMADEGWTTLALSEKFGVSQNTVLRSLRRRRARRAVEDAQEVKATAGFTGLEVDVLRALAAQVEVFPCSDCRRPVVGQRNVPVVMCPHCKTVYDAKG